MFYIDIHSNHVPCLLVEWSRTATQNPKKQSVVVITNVALSPASRSSSLSSEMTNSFGKTIIY